MVDFTPDNQSNLINFVPDKSEGTQSKESSSINPAVIGPVFKTMVNATYGKIPEFAKGVINGASFGTMGKSNNPMEESVMNEEGKAKSFDEKYLTPRKAGQFAGGLIGLIGADAMAGIPAEALIAKYGLGPVRAAMAQGAITGATFEGMKGVMQGTPPIETIGNMAKTGATFGALGAGAEMLPQAIKAAGNQLEKGSALSRNQSGVLNQAYEDPTLIFSPGIEKARKSYQEAKIGQQSTLGNTELETKKDFINRALGAAKNNNLDPIDALDAKHELYDLKDQFTDRSFHDAMDIFNNISNQAFKTSDVGYSRAAKADAMRNFFPQNKDKTTAFLKGAAMLAKPWSIPFVSPAAQGTAFTLAGAIDKLLSQYPNLSEAAARKMLTKNESGE